MPEKVHCLSTKTVRKRIDERYQAMKDAITKRIHETNFVCTTADMWSSRKRSYLGVTVHWLTENMQRESYAIACTRFKGTHDSSSIAIHIQNAHQRYGLTPQKIVFTVTDNAANMVKAFKLFGVDGRPAPANFSDDDGIDDSDIDRDDEMDIINLDVEVDNSANLVFLPRQIRCATHTLNLISTADINKAIETKLLKDESCDKQYRASIARCFGMWNYLSRSANKASEAFICKFGHFVKLPCPTRWNSLYDALSDVIKLDVLKLNAFCMEQKLSPLQSIHIDFLKEFVVCMTPIAVTLDKLQGENNLIMAELIPCVLNAHYLLRNLQQS